MVCRHQFQPIMATKEEIIFNATTKEQERNVKVLVVCLKCLVYKFVTCKKDKTEDYIEVPTVIET